MLAALAAGTLPVSARAAEDCVSRPQDEIWLVSTRHIGCLESGAAPDFRTQRYDAQLGWQPSDIGELFRPASADQILVIYVHGNRVPSSAVACEGRFVYRLLASQVDDTASIRFVIWSWPSAQVRGQLRDVRVKAQRTETDGYCLGWFLTQLPESQRVSLFGYSFGARIATGAMHLVGGGRLSGWALPPHKEVSLNTRAVVLAAALHDYWLRPGGYHDQAVSHLDFLLNLHNCCDPVLKRYARLYKHSHAAALGFSGMYTGDLGPVARRIEQQDVCGIVQRSHAAIHYLENSRLRRRIQDVLLWRPVGDKAAVTRAGESVLSDP